MPNRQDDDLLSVKEAARILGVTARTVERYGERGLITPVRLPSGHRRYRYADLVRLIAAPGRAAS